MEEFSKEKWERKESTARALWHYKNILLHIPHSSTVFPAKCNSSFNDLDDDERLLIDYFTDELFAPDGKADNIESLVFPYCRLYCDVERLMNDPLEKAGLGICYNRVVPLGRDECGANRSFGTRKEAFHQYVDFHSSAIKRLFDMGDDTLLIDCHSFSALPNLLNSNPPDIDICIGYNDDETRPNELVIGNIIQYFMSKGYKVGINEPFSNSKTFNVPVCYHSVMIEVNKRLYMNEQTLEKTAGFEKLRNDIQSLYELIRKG